MASLSRSQQNGTRLQFTDSSGKRRTISLGKMPLKTAETVKVHVERLNFSIITRSAPPDATGKWLDDLRSSGSTLLGKLAKAGLIEEAAGGQRLTPTTLGPFLRYYIETFSANVKKGTRLTWEQSERLALEYFDRDLPLRLINEGMAIQFQSWLRTRHHGRKDGKMLSEAYVRRRTKGICQILSHAVELKLLQANPFQSRKVLKSQPPIAQKRFITAEESARISDQLPNAQWRALFAMGRWCGARIPSEVRELRWTDIDWERGRVTLVAPKTAHHPGHERRTIPLFRETRTALEELWDLADTREERSLVFPWVGPRSGPSLRKPLLAAIKRAGLEPWEKLWVAMRATRDSELRSIFPGYVVDRWLGHSEAIAKSNYSQVLDSHYEQACALQIPTQQPAASAGIDRQRTTASGSESGDFPLDSVSCRETTTIRVGLRGFERNAENSLFSSVKLQSAAQCAAESYAVTYSRVLSQAQSLADSGLPAAAAGEALAALSNWIRNLAQLHNIEAAIDGHGTLCQVVDALVDADALSRTQATQVDKMVAFLSACVYRAPRSSQSLSAILESAAVLLSGK